MLTITKRISHLLATGNKNHLKQFASSHHPVDIAAAITPLRPEDILNVIETIGNHKSLEIFENLEKDTQKACLEYAAPERVITFFDALSTDEQADLLKLLSPDLKTKLLSLLEKSDREDLMGLVKYEEDTAGAHMTTNFFSMRPDVSAGQALTEIKKKHEEAETIYSIYVTDSEDHLVGVVSLKDLVLANSDAPIGRLMNPNVISAVVDEDVEMVAQKIAKYDLFAVPVVNGVKQMKGIITIDDVMDIVSRETTEDIYALGAAGAPIDYVGSSVLRIARQRLTWLLALVCTGFVTGTLLKLYQKELSLHVQLAFFIPLLNGSAGNAGTQAATVIVRGLATGELTTLMALKILFKEIRVGMLVGSGMGILAALFVFAITKDSHLAATVLASMVLVVSFAKSLGGLLPVLFKKMNLDPALMSGPLLASVSDIFSIVTYLTLAKLIIPTLPI
ncbi:MAG TPA: magnesium transporter [bacterium]|nr:magnesium transporter [bacterium]